MDTKPNSRASVGALGAGAAACAACCAGPVVGFIAATGIASLLGAVVFGAVGPIVVLASAAVLHRRRRRQRACDATTASADVPVPIDAPQLETRH